MNIFVIPDPIRSRIRPVIFISLAVVLAFSVFMAVRRPLPGVSDYTTAIRQIVGLILAWTLYLVPAPWMERRRLLGLVFLATLGVGVYCLTRINPDAEIVRVYGTLFQTMSSGGNPYTDPTIYHRLADGTARLGTFNYPPMEIFPYYLAWRIAGHWSSGVLTGAIITLQALSCIVLFWTFPSQRIKVAAFFPALLFFEVYTNSATSLFVASLIIMVIVRSAPAPRWFHHIAIAALFGIGLTCKFIIIPIFVAYYWTTLDRRSPRAIVRTVGLMALAVAVAAALEAPFGVRQVVESTLFFNLNLDGRATLTTYYANVLSGLMMWFGVKWLYPFAAVGALGIAIFCAPRGRLIGSMLVACSSMLLVSPTPEPQYLPLLIYMALAGQLFDRSSA